jgi:hypothetical protein
MLAPFQPGDDGRPVTSDDLLIGLVRDGYTIPGDLLGNLPMPETELILFGAILSDVNAKGGPGAGFHRYPAEPPASCNGENGPTGSGEQDG